MMADNISNFAGTSDLEIDHNQHGTLGPFVTLYQNKGSMTFMHNMRSSQARAMAAALIAHADAVEMEANEVPA